MADDGGYGWDITERALADVVGLDPDAEWLLGHGMNGGEARGQFLSRKLTARYEDRFFPDKADTSERSDSTGPPPFSLLISPEPGSTDGERILAVLDEISRTDEAPASPINFVDGNTTPFFVTYGSRDYEKSIRHSVLFIAALQRQHGKVMSYVFEGRGHHDSSLDLGQRNNEWVKVVRSWMSGG